MIRTLIFLAALASFGPLRSESLRCDGVLGNSGEQGTTLVRFGLPMAGGLGVVADGQGGLWDRAGTGVLNRYAWDGRLFATYKIPTDPPNIYRDAIVLLNNTIVLLIGTHLYSLSVDAPSGTEATPLNITATHLSLDSANGWAAATNGPEVFLVNATGEKNPIATLAKEPDVLEIGPDSTVYAGYFDGYRIFRVDSKVQGSLTDVGAQPGERFQFIHNFWYGHSNFGTVRRFNAALEPDPGAIMGGASGSFIGHLLMYPEQDKGCGLAQLTPDLFAVSGSQGVMHLLRWSASTRQCIPIRRIGAVPICDALGLDREGNVFFYAGNWEWSDGPAVPLRNGVPRPDTSSSTGAAVMLDDDTMVAYSSIYGHTALYEGKLTKEVMINQLPADSTFQCEPVALVSITDQSRPALLALQKDGKCMAAFIDAQGRFQGDAGPVNLRVDPPVKKWTSLATTGPDSLVGTADGSVIELARDGDNWKESNRWNSWGSGPAEQLGAQIFLSADAGRLWIADTTRNRVVVFDTETHLLLGVFGATGKAGEDLSSLSAPQTITARGQRAVVFDSANQRIVKLELVP